MKNHKSTMVLIFILLLLSVVSLFIGVLDVSPHGLLSGDTETIKIFFISRLPRLLAILCTGIGMSVAGLIMQQLCMNKFVSPSTGATISSAQFGILIAGVYLVEPCDICIFFCNISDVDFCGIYPENSV